MNILSLESYEEDFGVFNAFAGREGKGIHPEKVFF